jgi:hypothetical protein
MRIGINSKAFKHADLFRFVACAFSVLMLLTLPIRSGHQYTNHFRTPEVRRTVERHTYVAHTNAGPAESVPHQNVLAPLLATVDDGDVIKPVVDSEISTQIPISRLLLRLKLGWSRSGNQDPLL